MTSGLGRRVGALVLLGLVALQICWPRVFEPPRRPLFDAFQAAMPRIPTAQHVVVVAIDNDALKAVGPWPWPRDRQAALIRTLSAAHPKVIGFDGYWPEKQPGDDRLIAAVAGVPFVAGVEGTSPDRPMDFEGALPTIALAGGDEIAAHAPAYPSALSSQPALDNAVTGHGVLSVAPDNDGVYRRYPMISMLSGRPAAALALELYRVANKAPFISLVGSHGQAAAVAVGDARFPVARDGGVLIDFKGRDQLQTCSAASILAGEGCRLIGTSGRTAQFADLDDKFVLIGFTAPTFQDQDRKTPLNKKDGMPGVEIHAQALENIIAARFAERLPMADWIEAVLTLLFGGLLLALLPLRRPAVRVLTLAAPLVGLMGGSALVWWNFRVLVDAATPSLNCAAVAVAMLGGGLVEADAQRRRLRRDLEAQRIAAARAEGEMQAGRIIQMGILPKAADLARDDRFDLAALMVPARQIGGDLFDFFKIGPDHLLFAIGDVSGKGLPAALFMALGKALLKSCALRGETDIGAIVCRANEEISRDNPEMLFITVFAGILDLNTGALRFCNAGHDPPILVREGDLPRSIEGDGGPPLCIADDFPYPTEVITLRPGDLLCLTTDGVTEAMTEAGALWGREPVLDLLSRTGATDTAGAVTDRLQAAVTDFVDGAEPSDDLTILTLRWRGPSER